MILEEWHVQYLMYSVCIAAIRVQVCTALLRLVGETHHPVVPRCLQISKLSSCGIPKVEDLGLFIGKAGLMPKHTSSIFLLQDDASFLIFVTGLGDVYT